ncbi:hypothetical protein PSP30_gp4c [Pseudomonas phage PSP30]|nr:hypothetical protein PSP30_gp4c [Pseudomonas phage PSP30]
MVCPRLSSGVFVSTRPYLRRIYQASPSALSLRH